MAKKTKDKNKKNRPHTPGLFQFRDMTAERQYATQKAKAESLYQAERYAEALEILEPLAEKYPKRAELIDLLGVSYAGAGYYEDARAAYEQVLTLNPPKQMIAGVRHNLCQSYFVTTFPALAYEQSLLYDCGDLAGGRPTAISKCREFKQLCLLAIDELAAGENRSREEFLKMALPLERGRLALTKGDYPVARAAFLETIQANPKLAAPYNNLAMLDTITGDLAGSIGYSRHVLEKIDSQNIHALSNLVRTLVIQGERAEAESYLNRLRKLPLPTNPDGLIKLAEAYAAVEDDGSVYKTIFGLIGSPKEIGTLDSTGYEQAVRLAVVSAANQGHIAQAIEVIHEHEEAFDDILLERLHFALENNELGPLPGGRFFYGEPRDVFPTAYARYTSLLDKLAAQGPKFNQTPLKPFFEEYGEMALQVIAYEVWTSSEPLVVPALLMQVLTSQIPGSLDLVNRLAFSRVGDDTQRLMAASALVGAGIIRADAPVTVWLGSRRYTGIVPGLIQKLDRNEVLEAPDRGYDHDTVLKINEAVELGRQGKTEEAIQLYKQILKKHPEVAQASHNLAAVLTNTGNLEEALKYNEQARHSDPNYHHAQVAYIIMLLSTNRLEEAEAQMKVLEETLDDFYLDELLAFYRAKVSLYQFQQRHEEISAVLGQMLEIDPLNEWAKNWQMRLTISGFGGWFRELWDQSRTRRWKQWGRKLRPTITLKELVEGFNKDELLAILQSWRQYHVKSTLPKAQVKEHVLHLLTDHVEEFLPHVIDDEARQALVVLLELGGYAPYDQWQTKAGFADAAREEHPSLTKNSLFEKLPGRLLNLGIVVIGEVKGELMAATPADLRDRLVVAAEKKSDGA